MKLFVFVPTISIVIFFYSTNVASTKVEKDRMYAPTITELEKNRNKDFNGLWVNQDDQTKSITRCKIAYKNNSFVVQMWGSCEPQDCDWGENVANGVDNGTSKFELFWDQEFAESAITYEIIDGELKMTHYRHYKDNSGRPDGTLIEYFIRK